MRYSERLQACAQGCFVLNLQANSSPECWFGGQDPGTCLNLQLVAIVCSAMEGMVLAVRAVDAHGNRTSKGRLQVLTAEH